MKTTVIHHSADFDGLFCREIARKFIPAAELIGWDFGNAPLPVPEGRIYILDLPVDRVFGDQFSGGFTTKFICSPEVLERVVWIDHHKSSIESHPATIPGYRIDGVAACRLAWQFFTHVTAISSVVELSLTDKQHFVDRAVAEPWAVRLAGEYDIWDKRDTDAELFQHGLRSEELTNEIWNDLLDNSNPMSSTVVRLLNQGRALQYARTQENASIIKEMGFTFQWEGLTWLACNHARYNSHLFTAGLRSDHDACFGFKWMGSEWSVSLYHAPRKEHHDLSLIASKYGGGGHRGACGFRTASLPFLPPQNLPTVTTETTTKKQTPQPMKTLGQIAYEAYCDTANWKSLATGADLPQWAATKTEIQIAWETTAAAIFSHCFKEMPEPLSHISVKVMRSYDYCHFEIVLGSDIVATPAMADQLRKEAARLADKAVEQYKAKKANATKLEYSELKRLGTEASRIDEHLRTEDQRAALKAYRDSLYDYQDIWNEDEA